MFPFEADRSTYGPNDLRITPSYRADQVPRKGQFLNPSALFSISDLSRTALFLTVLRPAGGSKDARSFPRLKEMGELAGASEYPAANAAIARLENA